MCAAAQRTPGCGPAFSALHPNCIPDSDPSGDRSPFWLFTLKHSANIFNSVDHCWVESDFSKIKVECFFKQDGDLNCIDGIEASAD